LVTAGSAAEARIEATGAAPHPPARGQLGHRREPGKPVQNAIVESVHGRLRVECLDRHWFVGLADARATVEDRRRDDNRVRTPSALGYRTPQADRLASDGGVVARQDSIGL
jgi:transposase InsO family protein